MGRLVGGDVGNGFILGRFLFLLRKVVASIKHRVSRMAKDIRNDGIW